MNEMKRNNIVHTQKNKNINKYEDDAERIYQQQKKEMNENRAQQHIMSHTLKPTE